MAPLGALIAMLDFHGVAVDEFNDWYDSEHVPNLLKVPGVLAARRYRSVVGEHKYIALYHLRSPSVVESKAWTEAVETPWTHRMRPKTRDRMRVVCKTYRVAADFA